MLSLKPTNSWKCWGKMMSEIKSYGKRPPDGFVCTQRGAVRWHKGHGGMFLQILYENGSGELFWAPPPLVEGELTDWPEAGH